MHSSSLKTGMACNNDLLLLSSLLAHEIEYWFHSIQSGFRISARSHAQSCVCLLWPFMLLVLAYLAELVCTLLSSGWSKAGSDLLTFAKLTTRRVSVWGVDFSELEAGFSTIAIVLLSFLGFSGIDAVSLSSIGFVPGT